MNALGLRERTVSVLMAIALTGATLALAGCGGDDEAAATGGTGNQAPTISGSPPGSVVQGTAYAFTPTASDPDGNTLTFSVTNLPAWASFNATNGRISGTPTSGQVGTYSNIRISVSDGTTSTSLAAFSIQVVGTATGSAMLTWTPPTQNTDGSPLNNLAGYRVYWGTQQGNYPNSVTLSNPGLASYVVDQLTPAQWYFVVTAYSSTGVESGFSNMASKQVL
jgi:putative Ig domain-containing protein